MTPLEPAASDETIPMLTEVVQIPTLVPALAGDPMAAPTAELVERVRQAVTTQVLQQLGDVVDIGFRAELQRALQDVVDDACDGLQSSLERAVTQAVARALDEAMTQRSTRL